MYKSKKFSIFDTTKIRWNIGLETQGIASLQIIIIMTKKFKNIFRINSTRLHNWDYCREGAYFITICTQNREKYFGKIINGEMKLSEIGEIVKTEWIKTFEMRVDMNIQMGEYVIMPNHFHAIIIIGNNEFNIRRDAMHCVSIQNIDNNEFKNNFGPQSKNLASIIRGFKMGVTTYARKIHVDFAWQPRFYDHIIRNNESFNQIQTYISENPMKWINDTFYN